MQSSTIARRSLLNAVGTAPTLRAAGSKPVLAAFAQRRSAATQALTPKEHLALLNEQRLRRPGSPHLEIYQMQITMLLSGSHRATGNAMSIGLYAGAMTYLLHPWFPVLDSAHLVDLVHSLPEWLKGAGRFTLALPFTYHTFNGIRHLGWDLGKWLTIKGVYATGYATIAATFVSSAYLAFFF